MAVCPAWGTTLADVSLWTRLDLSASSGVRVRVTDGVLRFASGLARGGLVALDVSDYADISHDALLSVVASNAGSLRELSVFRVHTEEFQDYHHVDQHVLASLLLAAPNLSSLQAGELLCGSLEAQSLLRNEPPYGPLRARSVYVAFDGQDARVGSAPVHEVMAGVAEHAFLSALVLRYAPLNTPTAMDEVVDVVLSRRFHSLKLFACELSPASVPSLARLLRDGALTNLYIDENNEEQVLLNAVSGPLLCNALRANTTLTSLRLHGSSIWTDAAASAALLSALTAHPSVRKLSCSDWWFDEDFGDADVIVVGAALGALVAADAPALQSLSLTDLRINYAGLGPLLDALPSNTQLTELDISGSRVTQDCVRDVLLPAVRANVSLRSLRMENAWDSAREAMALVASRTPR
jgi:hypothetical protein